eukprot:CAMPEP_0181300348 /NCGR_PEP_ID=MMETSP1101-20121128/6840_1 /TAXON_ID=46948 /ORGANISM="Rhodomonas abbreviata, Strain Caron Lab Isolate" /LENGTH=215 /DNA_ID=CAMNT_0023405575 /DNA_START=24 /DNA_END=671 /DNA_ORIENTATION=-
MARFLSSSMLSRSLPLLLFLFCERADCISFDLASGKVKCFSEDMADNTLVVGDYELENIPDGQNRMPVDIQVTDPMEKVLYNKADASDGKFAFTTSIQGDYIVCFHNKGIPEFNTQRRIKLDMKHGIDAQDYSKVIKAEHLSDVQAQLRLLEDRTEQIRHEMAAQKQREMEMRDLTENTCSRVVWFAVFTMVVLAGTGWVETTWLFNYFKVNKYI